MFQHASAQPTNGGPYNTPVRTITSLKRWSCDSKDLPAVSDIKAIHVYDFDNTLFASPLPNKQIWNGPTISQLVSPDAFVNGGWWHDSSILASTGEGADKEEERGWKGWWNEQIVTLVELSMQQKDALTVLLTGRSEHGFGDLIKRIVRSRNLDFHMTCLKPAIGPANQKFRTTMEFKQELLREIVYTYKDAEEIRIYEDRVKHTKAFRDFFFNFNRDLMSNTVPQIRKPLTAEVVQVAENATQLESVTEVAAIQRLINSHNTLVKGGNTPRNTPPYQIKKTVFYTGYMIPQPITQKLISLVKLPPGMPEGDIRYLANSILITPKPCPKSILDKVGGLGNKVSWKVTGVSCFENKLWAARVEPVPKTQRYYSENPIPTVVLAIRKGGKPADAVRIVNWHPVPDEQSYKFESTVGEKMLLRVEEEQANESEWESYFPNKNNKRAHSPQDTNGTHHKPYQSRPDDRRQNGNSNNHRGNNQNRGGRGNNRNTSFGSRGGRGGGGGGGYGRGGQNGGRGRGRNGPSQYKSLDDAGGNYGQTNYDDPNNYY
ncbi:hypothetical protein BCR34DRAFT_486788 [Clohesyomyces aquaticus]|uniref:Swiss Army Knife RNA repair protein HAD domain-containing protein n=1 Tax=Clohesyomyces aquaticus TaxID=1231657 RepID=A0A1Y1ZHV3_9PLEO|nr:hypothetical protein BCR34DRAFT_486788 [Clohesyomyces aquaticus]